MKKTKMISGFLAIALLVAGCAAQEPVSVESQQEDVVFGALGAFQDDAFTLEEMLTYAIQDEYLAMAEYTLILDEFNVTNPFTNIRKAEASHIAQLIPLFEARDLPVPVDTSDEHVVIPADLEDVFATGVQAEIDNIAMYDAFLAEDLPEDVRLVFEALRAASLNHLDAFQRNLDRYR